MSEKQAATVVNVEELLRGDLPPKLAERIRAADVNNDGSLSIDELLDVMRSEERAVADRKLMRNFLIALVVAVLVLVATLCGTVYAIVKLTQEVNDDEGVLVSSTTGTPMATGSAYMEMGPSALYKYPNPSLLQSFDSVVLSNPDGDTMYKISKIVATPNVSATVYTADGTTIQADESGLYQIEEGAPNGSRRRLLEEYGDCYLYGKFGFHKPIPSSESNSGSEMSW
jgi:hypothetical protein